MRTNDSKNYLDWFRKADEDELNALSILKHRDGTPGMVCFLCQQMAEKYLKAFLVYLKKSFPKVHDLLQLQTLLFKIAPDIKNYNKELDTLSTYYFETRYPGDFPEFFWDEAEKAYQSAARIKKFVLKKVK